MTTYEYAELHWVPVDSSQRSDPGQWILEEYLPSAITRESTRHTKISGASSERLPLVGVLNYLSNDRGWEALTAFSPTHVLLRRPV